MGRAGFGIGPGSLYLPQSFSTYSAGIGKGLREPVSPYRTATVFGADLNDVDADGWNAVPEIVDPTDEFDLSSISINHEVVVALWSFTHVTTAYTITFDWYRGRDGLLLYEFPFSVPYAGNYGYSYWSWYYAYSYIGYVDWEIAENGEYQIQIRVNGTLYYSKVFSVIGITAALSISDFVIADYAVV